MKINPLHPNQVKSEQTNSKKIADEDKFKMFLNQATQSIQGDDKTKTEVINTSFLQPTLFNPIQRQDLGQRINTVFNLWENYASRLDEPYKNLKQMYSNLKQIQERLQELKSDPNFTRQPQDVQDLIQELEIMSTTEEIKINRGDYLS